MLSCTDFSRNTPWVLRSSGDRHRPWRMASRGEEILSLRPSSRMSPESTRSAPISARASSVRPAPTSPYTPRISPLCRVKLMSSSTPLRFRPRTSSTGIGPSAGPCPAAGLALVDLAADQHLDEGAAVDVPDRLGAHELAVAQHGDPVADLEDLLQAVGDVDDPPPLGLQGGDDLEQAFQLGGGQHGRRFVEDDDPGLQRQGLGDAHQLLPGDGQVPQERAGIDVRLDHLQPAPGLAVHLGVADDPRPAAAAGG